MKHIQAMINCNTLGHSRFEYDIGAGYVMVNVRGWFPFKEYISELSSELPGSWQLAYEEDLDQVVLSGGSGTIKLKFDSQSMADTLGIPGVETLPLSGTVVLGQQPKGITPIQSLHISDPVSGNTPSLRTFRHGRSHATAYGAAKNYDVQMRLDPADISRLQEGPCSAGKVRIGEYTASAAYSSADLSGYLDCYLLNQRDLTLENMEVGLGGAVRFEVVAPTTPHNSGDGLTDPFWGNLDRGYSLNYFCTIEGVPIRFMEKDVGFSSGDYTDSATLIIDNSQKVQYKIDRFKGLAAASGVTLGILDPTNSLEVFQRATAQLPITQDVAYDSDKIYITDSSLDFGTSGVAYLGKECFKYTANSGSFLGNVVRPYGEGYDYGKGTIAKFRTVTNRKRVWDGCEVDLRAMLLDPYGRPVGSSYTDAYTRQIFSGEVDGVPGYDSGIWILNTRDLIRRLTKKIGTGVSAKTSSRAGLDQGVTGVLHQTWARTTGFDVLYVTVVFNAGGADISNQFTYYPMTGSYGAGEQYATIGWYLNELFEFINNRTLTAGATSQTFKSQMTMTLIGTDQWVSGAGGNILFPMQVKKVANFYVIKSVTVSTGAQIYGESPNVAPSWLPQGVTLWDSSEGSSAFNELLFRNSSYSGTDVDFIVTKQPPNTDDSLGTFSGSGFAVLESDGDVNELISFESVDSSSIPNRRILKNCKRNLLGESVDVFQGDREVTQAVRTGTEEQGIDTRVGTLMSAVLESSGNNLERGGFDYLPQGFGYALKALKHVNDSSLVDPSEAISQSLDQSVNLILTGGMSFQEYFGGLAAAFSKCFSWVRVARDLKIGVVGTTTSGNQEKYTITDDDLINGDSASVVKVAAGPNQITIKSASSPIFKGKNQYTYRVIEDMLARGTVAQTLNLYGVDEGAFFALAQSISAKIVNASSSEVAYKLKCKPSRDWLPGQLVRLNITHPALYDWKNQTDGLQDIARIMEVSRDLASGECEITLVTGATTFTSALCPATLVTGYDNSASDAILTVADSTIFEKDEVLRAYNPGTMTADEKSIVWVKNTTNEIKISGHLSFTPSTNYTTCSYPKDDNSLISARQRANAHVLDGGFWS